LVIGIFSKLLWKDKNCRKKIVPKLKTSWTCDEIFLSKNKTFSKGW
jgi:hypothetical protein